MSVTDDAWLRWLSARTRTIGAILLTTGTPVLATLLWVGVYQLSIVLGTVLGGVALYLLIQRVGIDESGTVPDYRLLLVGAYGSISLAFVVLVLAGTPIFRPVLFFLLVAVGAALVSLLSTTRYSQRVTLLFLTTAFVLVFLYKLTFFYAGVHSGGGDQNIHILRAASIHTTGHTFDMPGYNTNPAFHVLWSSIASVLGVTVFQARLAILAISAAGVFPVYVLSREFTRSLPTMSVDPALITAVIYIFFTLSNRTKLQTEALLFSVVFPLVVFVFYRLRADRRFIFLLVLGAALTVATHTYYPSLLALVLTAFVLAMVVVEDDHRFRSRATVAITVVWLAWATNIVLLTTKFGLAVVSIARIIRNPLPESTTVQPSFISANPTPVQFLTVHLGEFLVLLFAVGAGMYWLYTYHTPSTHADTRQMTFALAFLLIAGLNTVAIFVEGQGKLAWGISYRNFYAIAILLCVFAGSGYAMVHRSALPSTGHIKTGVFVLLVLTTCFFAMTSQQANNVDPVFYTGEAQTPRFTTNAQMTTMGNFYDHAPADSLVVGDVLTVHHAKVEMVTDKHMNTTQFSEPSLPERHLDYDYLFLNRYAVERGILYQGAIAGLGNNMTVINTTVAENNVVWDSGDIRVLMRSRGG